MSNLSPISRAASAPSMQVVHTPGELRLLPPRLSLAIGFFDGVHLGHQQVIRQAQADAQAHNGQTLVVTFDRHPNTVVAPDRTPALIYPLELKLRNIARLGVPSTLLLPFDEALSRQPAEVFIRSLTQAWPPIGFICVGSHFKFGFRRQGNLARLQELGRALGFVVHGVAPVSIGGHPVSSTRIRNLIERGEFAGATQMLGRPYVLAGRVTSGDHLGQRLGFPTANLDTAGLVTPPRGVYAVHAHVAGASHRAVLNLGCRPTLNQPEPQLRAEVHLLDFEGDLYGAEMEVSFVRKLREEQKFPSLPALQQQIRSDIAAARSCLATPP